VRPRTIRVRLTALYAGLFLATATILLVTVNLLLTNRLQVQVAALDKTSKPPAPGTGDPAVRTAIQLQHNVLRFQWLVTGVVIAALTVVSVAVGWWLAGRVLRPIHTITATARRLSLSNLHQRIAMNGPRDELKDLADTFDAMLDRLERSVDSQRRFVANASHELRTPLAIQRAAIHDAAGVDAGQEPFGRAPPSHGWVGQDVPEDLRVRRLPGSEETADPDVGALVGSQDGLLVAVEHLLERLGNVAGHHVLVDLVGDRGLLTEIDLDDLLNTPVDRPAEDLGDLHMPPPRGMM
jgi:signal transduction histidine kinase